MKKLMLLLIAVVMVFSLSVSALAAGEEVEYDWENYSTLVTTGVLDWDLEFTMLPSAYNEYEPEHQMTSKYIHYTTDAYDNGVTYDKFVRVYLPYGYDENDKDTKYNIIYFQHGNGGTPNVFDENLQPAGRPGAKPMNLFNNMFNEETRVMDPVILVCTTYYMELEENSTYSLQEDRLAGDNTGTGLPANYYREVVEDLIPQVESQLNGYCTDFSDEGIKATRDHRCWAGYSRGSVCTWYTFHHNLEYFKYFMPTSAPCTPDGMGTEYESEEAQNEAAFEYIKESIDAHPDLDFYIIAGSGGDRDAVTMRTQMKSFLEHEDVFSYGKDPKVNNFYYVCAADFIHSDVFFPRYLFNARDMIFK